MLLAAIMLQVAAPATNPEALSLARRLAGQGTLATILPMMVKKDLADLAAERPQLTPDQRRRLIATGEVIAAEQRTRLLDTLARGYAKRLSLADLRTLVAAAETPAAARKRAADLPVIAETMGAMGSIDLKKLTAERYCRETKLFCDRQ